MEMRFALAKPGYADAMAKSPETMIRYIEGALERATHEGARDAKDRAPKAFSNLVNSIRGYQVAPLHWRVSTGVNHALAVEQGTGPAVGATAYMPNPDSLMAYVKLRASVTSTAKPGTAKRRGQEREVRDRAWALARHIQKHGTKPHAYMGPAGERMAQRAPVLVGEAVDRGIREILE